MLTETTAGVTAIADAIGVTLPGAGDASAFASYLEALVQIAQGAGFDGNDNGSRTQSGPAGVAGTATAPGYLNPGDSGDVPPFSTKPATVPSAGTLGGVGFRAGAQKIVLLATNTYPVSPNDRGQAFPEVVTGVGGIEVPSSFFQEVITFPLRGLIPEYTIWAGECVRIGCRPCQFRCSQGGGYAASTRLIFLPT